MERERPTGYLEAGSKHPAFAKDSVEAIWDQLKFWRESEHDFALATSIVAVVGFVVFLRYCVEISYFPELSLSGGAGFFAAIFFLSLLIVTMFLSLWYAFSMLLKDILRQWEGYQNQGRQFVPKIYTWILISLIFPSLLLFMVPLWCAAVCAVLMGIALPFWSRLRFIKPHWIKSLPCKLTIELCVFGRMSSFIGFIILALAYFKWGWIGMVLALYGALLLLLFSMSIVIPDKRDIVIKLIIAGLIVFSCFFSLSFFLLFQH